MEDKINEILEKLKRVYMDFFSKPEKTLSEAETFFREPLNEATAELISAYYEKTDEAIRTDRLKLREMGLLVVRRNDPREILTVFGSVCYRRTYFRTKSGEYVYPTDSVTGIKPYQRLSSGVNEGLVKEACAASYAKSAQIVAQGRVSRQSVMRKIRESSVPDTPEAQEKPKPEALHIDADEDHNIARRKKRHRSACKRIRGNRKKRKARNMPPHIPHRPVWQKNGRIMGRSPDGNGKAV